MLADGKPVSHMIQWRGGFGDLTVPAPSSYQHSVHYDITLKSWWRNWLGLAGTGGLVDQGATAASKGPIQNAGTYSFAGIADAYFAAVFLPVAEDAMRQTVFTDTVPTPAEAKPVALSGDAFSDGDSNRFGLFVGPKDVDLLKGIDPKLEQLVDFGFASALAKPLFLIVNWANDQIVHNFGWSIILVTVLINFALFPLKLSSMKSMRKMQALKPQIDAINAKYKGISVRDPKKSEQTEETMALYKKHGVNPMGGCLPMVIQLPILYAFYAVLRNSVEMRGASWLWVSDLSQPEHLPIKLLPIILIVTQFLTQKMMPQPGADPAQQKMTMFMPLIFGFMFYNFQSGLVLYYLTSNLVGIAQQWFFNHTDTARAVALSVEPPAKKRNGKK
jgi:YidC/Oxa1 family membrane protein insertase